MALAFKCSQCNRTTPYKRQKRSAALIVDCPSCYVTSRTSEPWAVVALGLFLIVFGIGTSAAIILFTHLGVLLVPIGIVTTGICFLVVACRMGKHPRSQIIKLDVRNSV